MWHDERHVTYRFANGAGFAFVQAEVAVELVDELNILEATLRYMQAATLRLLSQHLTQLQLRNAGGRAPALTVLVCIDGNRAPKTLDAALRALAENCAPNCALLLSAQTVVGGDAKIPAISAASIVAKVARDDCMLALDKTHPEYQFAKHKGYGTAAHRAAIKRLGPSPQHRLTFEPTLGLILSRAFPVPAQRNLATLCVKKSARQKLQTLLDTA